MLANHKRGIFPLKRGFWGESQRSVRRLSNQISSFRSGTHQRFSSYVQLTFMLYNRIHGISLIELTVQKAFQSYVFHLSIERATMKTQQWKHSNENTVFRWYLKGGLSPFCSPLTTPTGQKKKFSIRDFSSKCHQIPKKLRIWSHLLDKSLMENFIFCAVAPANNS